MENNNNSHGPEYKTYRVSLVSLFVIEKTRESSPFSLMTIKATCGYPFWAAANEPVVKLRAAGRMVTFLVPTVALPKSRAVIALLTYL